MKYFLVQKTEFGKLVILLLKLAQSALYGTFLISNNVSVWSLFRTRN